MHELSIMGNIIDIVIEYAEKNDAKIVKIVNLKIGLLSDVIPDWAQNYFDFLSKDTVAEQAKLNIERVPVTIKCKSCNSEFTYEKDWQFFCEKCDSTEIDLVTGRELSITSIEID